LTFYRQGPLPTMVNRLFTAIGKEPGTSDASPMHPWIRDVMKHSRIEEEKVVASYRGNI